jgi:phosphoribosylanthranilate isomerase
MTDVKICGITNAGDAMFAARCGADALGYNFYARSPRFIARTAARSIIERLPANILNVGVFVNEPLRSIVETALAARIGAIQLHGDETPDFARKVGEATGLKVIKAFRVTPGFRPERAFDYDVDAVLLDAFDPRVHGGTGETFDWSIAVPIAATFEKTYLAGGLNPENVASAVRIVRPFGVDACSGLESAKGVKDAALVESFLRNAKNA